MTGVRLVLHQIRYDLTTFRRDSASVFFTAILPVVFLVVFATIFGNERIEGRDVRLATYYVPGIVALAVVSATFVNLAISLTALREDGVLKRLRGTPLPAWVFVAGRVAAAYVLALVVVVVLCAIGVVFYGVDLPGRTLPGFLLTLLLGTATFCCLGIALTPFIPTKNASSAITNAIVLPLYFVSGTFFPVDDAPAWMRTVAAQFPIRHLNAALFHAFDPATTGTGLSRNELVNLAIWGAIGFAVAMRSFRWTPRREWGA